jgi:hypothetical protein
MNNYLKYSLIGIGSLALLGGIGGISYFVYSQYKKAEGSGEVSAKTKENRNITFVR